jgi:hypothetical protein
MPDTFDDFADSGNDVEGVSIRSNGKTGRWKFDDTDKGPAPVERFVLILELLKVGEIGFKDDGAIIRKTAGRMLDGATAPKRREDLTPGFHPYLSCPMVFADGEYRGEVATFSGCSWGALFAIQRPVKGWQLRKRLAYPVVLLRTRERGDANGTVDPVFETVDWTSRSNFKMLLGEDTPLLEAPPTAPRAVAVLENNGTVIERRRGIAAQYDPPQRLDTQPEDIEAEHRSPVSILTTKSPSKNPHL